MKGTNTIKFSHEAMCEAMQAWIDTIFDADHRQVVKSVESEKSGYQGGVSEFNVILSEPEKP